MESLKQARARVEAAKKSSKPTETKVTVDNTGALALAQALADTVQKNYEIMMQQHQQTMAVLSSIAEAVGNRNAIEVKPADVIIQPHDRPKSMTVDFIRGADGIETAEVTIHEHVTH